MELICIFPFVGNLMIRNGYFDKGGNIRTQGLQGLRSRSVWIFVVAVVVQMKMKKQARQNGSSNENVFAISSCFGYVHHHLSGVQHLFGLFVLFLRLFLDLGMRFVSQSGIGSADGQ